MTTLRIKHIRQSGFCARGTRQWCERHNINYQDFLINGIDTDVISAVDDHFGNIVVANAKAEEEEQRLKEARDGQG